MTHTGRRKLFSEIFDGVVLTSTLVILPSIQTQRRSVGLVTDLLGASPTVPLRDGTSWAHCCAQRKALGWELGRVVVDVVGVGDVFVVIE